MTALGIIFPPDQPPERLRDVATAADRAGLEQLWLWEDCFKESGIATAGAILGWTERITVGIGLLPVPLRNVALTAMELATLERLFPGRLIAGIGHGVLEWMDQVDARAESPMMLLREYAVALTALLRGETVTTAGRYVSLTDVALGWPPAPPPPLLVGGIKTKTVALAGELSDGVIFPGDADPDMLGGAVPAYLAARADAGRAGPGDVVAFCAVDQTLTAATVAERVQALVVAGATTVPLLLVGDGDLDHAAFARMVATEVRPLVP